MLTINNICKKYNDHVVLDNVSFSVERGSIAVLLGSSGVGKSTLLRILNNLETIDRGTITLDDVPVDVSTLNRTHMIGMVFQQFNLFAHLTVEENITLPLEKVLHKTAEQARSLAHALLTKYELVDKTHKPISTLSGGQKQRLALARTLAMQPQIICLDEPTSALDPLLKNYVAQTIQTLASEGYMIIIATHDTSLLIALDCTIYLMRNGKIVENARSKDVFLHASDYPLINRFVSGKSE